MNDYERQKIKNLTITELIDGINDLKETCAEEDCPEEYQRRLEAYENEYEGRGHDESPSICNFCGQDHDDDCVYKDKEEDEEAEE